MFSAIFAFVAGHILYFALHLQTGSFPAPLTKLQEKQAFEKFKQGDNAAKDLLIRHNLRLVAHVIKKYYKNSHEHEDFISIGTIGLIKAVNSFNYDKGARFSTYAARCIENELLMFFRQSKKDQNTVYLYDELENDASKSSITISDTMADSFDMPTDFENKENIKKLYAVIKTLDTRSRQIIILRYGLNGTKPLTQQKVSKLLKISRSYVSRIEKRVLQKLKNNITL